MKNQCTIIMYHYVRELQYTRYPHIKGLLASEFKEQLEYMEEYYKFVTIDDCINAVYNGRNLPSNAAILTFDDAYIDHFITVFPILDEKNIKGCFFPPAKAILEHVVLDVNKIHFIIASATSPTEILNKLYRCLNKYRSEYDLESNNYYFSKFAKKHPWMSKNDSKEIIFIKTMLQVELEEKLRNIIVDELFQNYVSKDEECFSRELYMSVDQIKCMVRNGMYIGSHGYEHFWMNTLSADKQQQEINLSLKFLKKVGSPIDNWIMCYPKGAYDNQLIEILKKNNCKLGLTTNIGVASLSIENAFTLERLDTNDLPKVSINEANSWTRKVLNLAK